MEKAKIADWRFLFVWLAVGASSALADSSVAKGVALNLYNPAPPNKLWFSHDPLDFRGNLRSSFAATLDYAYLPFIIRTSDDHVRNNVIRNQAFLYLDGSLIVHNRLRLGLNLPYLVWQNGETALVGDTQYGFEKTRGLGDIRVNSDFRLFGHYDEPLTIAFSVQVFAPTGNQADYVGDGSLRTLAAFKFAGKKLNFNYGASTGMLVRGNKDAVGGVKRGNEIVGTISGGWSGLGPQVFVGAEITASHYAGTPAASEHVHTFAEALLSIHYTPAAPSQWFAAYGEGVGLTRGLGVPSNRRLLSGGWIQEFTPNQPVVVKLPPPPIVVPPPPAPQPIVALQGAEIKISEQIHFKTDSDEIITEGAEGRLNNEILDSVVSILTEHPEIKLLRIEGHADFRGPSAYNMQLSKRRAESVVQWLIHKGIAASRLKSIGFGSTRPLREGTSSEDLEVNRRVEFHIEKEKETP